MGFEGARNPIQKRIAETQDNNSKQKSAQQQVAKKKTHKPLTTQQQPLTDNQDIIGYKRYSNGMLQMGKFWYFMYAYSNTYPRSHAKSKKTCNEGTWKGILDYLFLGSV